MSLTDLGIVMLCAVLGWGIVSWIISVVQQQKAPPLDLSGSAPPPPLPASSADSPPRPSISRADSPPQPPASSADSPARPRGVDSTPRQDDPHGS